MLNVQAMFQALLGEISCANMMLSSFSASELFRFAEKAMPTLENMKKWTEEALKNMGLTAAQLVA